MNNFIKVRGLCAPSSFCVYKIVFDFFWFYVKFWGIQDFNIIDLDNI